MRNGAVVLLATLLLAACGEAKQQQSASADIPFDTRAETRSGPVGRSEITGIDATISDAEKMPADSDMLPPAPPSAAAVEGSPRPAAPAAGEVAPVAATVPTAASGS